MDRTRREFLGRAAATVAGVIGAGALVAVPLSKPFAVNAQRGFMGQRSIEVDGRALNEIADLGNGFAIGQEPDGTIYPYAQNGKDARLVVLDSSGRALPGRPSFIPYDQVVDGSLVYVIATQNGKTVSSPRKAYMNEEVFGKQIDGEVTPISLNTRPLTNGDRASLEPSAAPTLFI